MSADQSYRYNNVFQTNALQAKILAATAGTTVELNEIGEYEGIVLIDKPLRLRGEGDLTPIWRRRGPVIVVRTPDVELVDLHVETIHQSNFPAILYHEGCEPTLINTQGDLAAMSANQMMINLGVVPTNAQLQLEFDFPKTAVKEDDLPDNVVIKPGPHNAYDHETCVLNLTTPEHGDTYIFDQIVFNDGSYYLFSAFVDGNPPRPQRLVLGFLEPRSGNKRRIHPSMRLDLNSTLLGHLLRQNTARRYYATILHDHNNQHVYLWQSFTESGVIHLNGKNVNRWELHRLQTRDQVYIPDYDVTFSLEASRKERPLGFQPAGVNFSNTRSLDGSHIIRLNLPSRGRIAGMLPGNQNVDMSVAALVPWLDVPDAMTINRDNGAELVVRLNQEAVLQLPQQAQTYDANALLFDDKSNISVLPAVVELQLPRYDFEVAGSQPIVFANADNAPIYEGEIPTLQAVLDLRNTGMSPVTLELREIVRWLSLDTEALFAPLQPGEKRTVSVRFNQQVNALVRHGTDPITAKGIVLGCKEVEKVIELPVELAVHPPREARIAFISPLQFTHTLSLDDLSVQFKPGKEFRRDKGFALVFSIKNKGNRDGYARFANDFGGKFFDNATEQAIPDNQIIALAAGQQVKLFATIDLAAVTQGHSAGYAVDAKVELQSSTNGEHFEHPMILARRFQLVRSQILMEPLSKDLGKVIAGQDFSTTVQFTLHNEGSGPFWGRLVANPKLKGVPDLEGVFEIKAQEAKHFEVTITKDIAQQDPGIYDAPMFTVVWEKSLEGREMDGLRVRLRVESNEPKPRVSTLLLFFGQIFIDPQRQQIIDDPESRMRGDVLTIENSGHGKAILDVIEINDVIEIVDAPFRVGDRIIVEGMTKLDIPVALHKQANLPQRTGEVNVERAIVLQTVNLDKNTEMIVPAKYTIAHALPRLHLQPQQIDFGVVDAMQASKEELLVEVQNTGLVPWEPNLGTCHLVQDMMHMDLTADPIPPGASRLYPIHLTWNPALGSLPGSRDSVVQAEFLLTDGRGTNVSLPVQFTLVTATVILEPASIELSYWGDEPIIHARNIGKTDFTLRFGDRSNLLVSDGIKLEPQFDNPGEHVLLPPNETKSWTARYDPATASNTHGMNGYIRLVIAGEIKSEIKVTFLR